MSHGGRRDGAGRKPKTEEIALVEKLSPLDDVAFKALERGVRGGDYNFIKLFMEYRHGKPKQSMEVKTPDLKTVKFVMKGNNG